MKNDKLKPQSEGQAAVLSLHWENECIPGNLLKPVISWSVSHYTATLLRMPVLLCASVSGLRVWGLERLGNKNMIYDTGFKRDIYEVIWHAPVSSNHSLIVLVLNTLNLQLLLFYDLITSVKLWGIAGGLKESCSQSACWAEDNYREGEPRQSQRNSLWFIQEWKDSL